MIEDYSKIIVIHPGTQHAFRLANALATSFPTIQVKFYTWFITSTRSHLSKIWPFNRRVVRIHDKVIIKNFLLFEVALLFHKKLKTLLSIPNNNNPYYIWQTIFGFFLLPILFINRKKTALIIFETCGWPIVKYAQKWKIPVVMEFSAISHESAASLGIGETILGIKIKSSERRYINYGFNCSKFAANTYNGKTSAKRHYPIWLGTDFKSNSNTTKIVTNKLICCCIGNSEKIKGIDILLEAFNAIKNKEKLLYIIGNINCNWVKSYCKEKEIPLDKVILSGKIKHQDLKDYLVSKCINLHILPSRFDSFGMVVPETMALGIPNIVSPYVGAGEMLQHGTDGYVMNTLSADELTKFIYEYINLSDECKVNLSMAALKKAEQMTWENYNERIKVIFEEILLEI